MRQEQLLVLPDMLWRAAFQPLGESLDQYSHRNDEALLVVEVIDNLLALDGAWERRIFWTGCRRL